MFSKFGEKLHSSQMQMAAGCNYFYLIFLQPLSAGN
jgi:hypothetical protein